MHNILKHLFLSLTSLLTLSVGLYGQPLKIGQKCPDVVLKDIINYPASEAKLSDFKGKLVILDFWGLYCSGCIAAFPEMDSLQRRFGNKIQIIMVNKEDEDSTKRFFAERKNIKMPPLPFVTGDSILSGFFPHLLVPHHVWIDSTGTVRYITDGWNTTAAHIQDFLEGKDIRLPEKRDILHFDWDKPFITIADSNIQNQVEYYSYIMHAINGLSGSYGIDSKGGSSIPNHISFNRAPAIRLFAMAFGENGKYDFEPRNTVILEVKDTSKYIIPKNIDAFNKWQTKYSYCYELMVPPSQADQLYTFMQQDLMRYFGVKAKVEKRNIKCLVLCLISRKDKLQTKGGTPKTNFYSRTEDSIKYYHNHPFNEFVSNLKGYYKREGLAVPFIDGTGYSGNVDIEISADVWANIMNISAVNNALKKYDLQLKEKDLPTEVLVIRDVKGNH